VGLRAGLDRCGKSRPTRIRSPDRQPVGSRYTDYATRSTPFILNIFKKEICISVIMRKPVSNQTDCNHFYRTEESQLLIHEITLYRIKTVRFSHSASYITSKNEGKNSVDIVSLPELPFCKLEKKTSNRRTRSCFTDTQRLSVAVRTEAAQTVVDFKSCLFRAENVRFTVGTNRQNTCDCCGRKYQFSFATSFPFLLSFLSQTLRIRR